MGNTNFYFYIRLHFSYFRNFGAYTRRIRIANDFSDFNAIFCIVDIFEYQFRAKGNGLRRRENLQIFFIQNLLKMAPLRINY